MLPFTVAAFAVFGLVIFLPWLGVYTDSVEIYFISKIIVRQGPIRLPLKRLLNSSVQFGSSSIGVKTRLGPRQNSSFIVQLPTLY